MMLSMRMALGRFVAAGSAIAVLSSGLAAVPGAADPADAASEAGTVWLPVPNGDGIELGNHALNLNLRGGASPTFASLSDNLYYHSSSQGDTGAPSGFAIGLETGGATGWLPGGPGPQLASERIGESASSTFLEGSAGGVRLHAGLTHPILPSRSVDEDASKLTNGPFVFLDLQVGGAPTAVVHVRAQTNSACGTPQPPVSGWNVVSLCSSSENGTRYLAFPASVWDGTIGRPGGGIIDLPIRVTGRTVGLYSAYTSPATTHLAPAAGVKAPGSAASDLTGAPLTYYYTAWWPTAAAAISWAALRAASAVGVSATWDRAVGYFPDNGTLFAAIHGLRAWESNSWLLRRTDGTPFYTETEGNYAWLSTVDVAYEYHQVQTRIEPWASRLELDEWAAHDEVEDSNGQRYILHDLGVGATTNPSLTPGAGYNTRGAPCDTSRTDMPVEENANYVAMALLYEQVTGEPYRHDLLARLLAAADTQGDGSGQLTQTTITATPSQGGISCQRRTGTTYDGTVDPADAAQAGSTISTLKLAVVERLAALAGVPVNSSLVQSYFDWAYQHRTVVNATSSSPGAGAQPGSLADPLLYAASLRSTDPALTSAAGWAIPVVAGIQQAQCPDLPCLHSLSSGETETWISKTLDTDVVRFWAGASPFNRASAGLQALYVNQQDPQLSAQTTYEVIKASSGVSGTKGVRYPRAGSIWGLGPLVMPYPWIIATQQAPPVKPRPHLVGLVAQPKVLRIGLSCEKGRNCQGIATVTRTIGKRSFVLAKGGYKVPAGTRRTVVVPLTSYGKAVIKARHPVTVTVRLGDGRNALLSSSRVKLRPPHALPR